MAQKVFVNGFSRSKCLIYIMVNHHQIIYDNLYVQHEQQFNSIRLYREPEIIHKYTLKLPYTKNALRTF